jgi:hypothetical protein
MLLSSDHASSLTVPSNHVPLRLPSLCSPSGVVQSTLTFVPSFGIQKNCIGISHVIGTVSCITTGPMSCSVSLLVPLAILSFFRGSFRALSMGIMRASVACLTCAWTHSACGRTPRSVGLVFVSYLSCSSSVISSLRSLLLSLMASRRISSSVGCSGAA